jgi:4-hydroxy-tetrahydrodipicolinate synthase
MDRAELKRLMVGPMAGIPLPFNEDLTPDLGALAELVRWWVDSGIVEGRACVKVCGGVDGPNLEDSEWPPILRTAVEAAAGRAPVLVGLRPRNTLHYADDVNRTADLGATGVQIDLPFFNFPTQDDMVRFLAGISERVAIGIMVKNCFWFGVDSLTPDSIRRLADAEHFVAVKWDVPDRAAHYDDMREFAHVINVIDDSSDPVRCHRNGGRGYVDGWLIVHPPFALRVWDLLEAERYDEAQALYDSCRNPLGRFWAEHPAPSGGDYAARALLAAIGRPIGPPRPPTIAPLPEHIAGLRQVLAGMPTPLACL